jgi:uncharacterized protein involved in response to NO
MPQTDDPQPPTSKSFLSLLGQGEPFRLLFPLGTVIGIAGVLLWPLFAGNLTKTYPGTIHPRVMIEGFLTSFVLGFLGTALPRLLDVPRFTLGGTLGLAGAQLLITLLHLAGNTLGGDLVFFFTLLTFVGSLVIRAAIFRKDTPPPAFVLVAMGLTSALLGSLLLMLTQIIPATFPAAAAPLGRLLLNQGYLLLPIMGVGAFLLPRFFALPNRQSFPESVSLPPGWIRRALFALLCGLAILFSFVLEACGWARLGYGTRAAAVILYFAKEVPVHQAGFGGGSLALSLRLALFAIPAGFILMAVWPERVFSFLHVVFITGFSLLTFVVASRVILGHSGQSDRFRASLWPVLALAACLTVAMLTRVSADWFPLARMGHYAYAAAIWITGVIIWAIALLPSVRKEDVEN